MFPFSKFPFYLSRININVKVLMSYTIRSLGVSKYGSSGNKNEEGFVQEFLFEDKNICELS